MSGRNSHEAVCALEWMSDSPNNIAVDDAGTRYRITGFGVLRFQRGDDWLPCELTADLIENLKMEEELRDDNEIEVPS